MVFSCIAGNCSLPPVTGICLAAFQRYFYNSTARRCETFTWGGCGGNGNNFQTMEDCENTCASGKANIIKICLEYSRDLWPIFLHNIYIFPISGPNVRPSPTETTGKFKLYILPFVLYFKWAQQSECIFLSIP